MVQFTQQLKLFIRTVSNIHLPGLDPNVFLFTTPRSGSTWLMEMIWSQPGFKYCNEPLNLRVPDVVRHLGITTWEGLYSEAARPKIETYFRGLIDGSIRFSNPSPLHKYYRPFTRRIIFKILNGQEDRISWFADTFNGRILFLLRHPIPVSLSRKQLPRLETFVKSEYKRHFTVKQLTSAERVIANGSNLERGVLSWCFQNAVPLRDRRPDWIVMTYEQTVLEPEVIIRHLARRLDLPNPECMLARVAVPSRSTNLSDVHTQRILSEESGEGRRQQLVRKWQQQVSPAEADRVLRILDTFAIDAYQFDDPLPAPHFWIADKRQTVNEQAVK